MSELIVGISLTTNLIFIGGLLFLVVFKKSDKAQVEVHYFEHIVEIEGVIRDSKKVTVSGQIFIDGVPVGGQYVVAEKVFEKVDYEKIKNFKKEVIEPLAKVAIQTGQLVNGLPDGEGATKTVFKVANFIKSKLG